MDFNGFYKELMTQMALVLKSYGFRKKGMRFYRVRENHIANVVEIQKSQFNFANASSFTVNIHVGLTEKTAPTRLQFEGRLGETLEDGWKHQKWYELREPNDPLVVDGRYAIRSQMPGQPMQEIWVPCVVPEKTIPEICGLLENKALPFFQSISTPEEYLRFYRDGLQKSGFHVCLSAEDFRLYAAVLGREVIPNLVSELDRRIAHNKSELEKPDLYYMARERIQGWMEELVDIRREILESGDKNGI